ncbi:hypothetical protein Lp90_1975 [Lactiplantibacillus plantarum]|uniref:hypothetical protein n=1 Tax=Lactiplantibacillus plantarum TaxID=1590 RepID=UPI0004DCE094|nr:hypothetical protein [Lactiplantibacillus plantarum]KEZ13062.1 hypothetical protein Lp90_1975 [Lactiplantibacillus plantarum]
MTRFIGYNNEENPELGMSNLYLTIGAKKLGLKKNFNIEPGETVYFSYKENGVWYVKARATVIEQLSQAPEPWNDGNNYYRWSLKDVYEFPPFELDLISSIDKKYKGILRSQPKKMEQLEGIKDDVNQLKTATNAIINSLHLHAR